jgi:carboxyl-terminal processing protease
LTRRDFLIGALVVAAFAAGGFVGARTDLFGERDGGVTAEALSVISGNYFHAVNDDRLEDASVRAMVDDLRHRYDDHFSHYFDPKDYRRFQAVTAGRFSGIGLSVTEVPRGLRVSEVFGSSPAKQAGIRVGDVITGVNGHSIAGEDADVATARIKGRSGTAVTITVRPRSGGPSRRLTLTRASITLPEVQGSIKRANGIPVAYVRLLSFTTGVDSQLKQKLQQLYARGAEGLVLDLRGNGGGLLTQAVLTSSLFIEHGPIVTTESRTQGKHVYDAVGDALPDHPAVVLINGDTASAAEILTAALEESGIAKTVGTRSFGKGTFQQVIQLDNGGALDLTIGQYLTRNGTSINHVGIKPEFKVRDRPRSPGDEQLRRALQVLGSELPSG